MSLAADLLDQADMLSRREPKNLKQASLRRAVSAAYYALFHLLAEDAARLFASICGRHDAEPVARLVRTFAHIDMRKASDAFIKSELPIALRPAVTRYQTPSDLMLVATAFGSLYQARQEADYNIGQTVSRQEVEELIREASEGFAAWDRVKSTDDARMYLACFSLWKTWNIDRSKQQ